MNSLAESGTLHTLKHTSSVKMTAANKMLERALSIRRPPHPSEVAGPAEGDGDDVTGDESKNRKHMSIAMRVTNYLTRTGYIWPIIVIGLIIIIILSVIVRSQDLVCISASSSDYISRLRFFGFDGLESDFGSLGVPWCKFLLLFWLHFNFSRCFRAFGFL